MTRSLTQEEIKDRLDKCAAEIRRISQELYNGEYAPSYDTYREHAKFYMSRSWIEKKLGGWPAFVESLGYKTAMQLRNNVQDRIDNTIAEIKRIAQELHDSEFAPNLAEYYHHCPDPMTGNWFRHNFGSYQSFVEDHCGLQLGTSAYYFHAAAERRQNWRIIDDAPIIKVVDTGKKRDRAKELAREAAGLTCMPTPRVDVWRSSDGKVYQGTAWMIR